MTAIAIQPNHLALYNKAYNIICRVHINVSNEHHHQTATKDTHLDHSVKLEFPALDILLIQEVWDVFLARKLMKHLHKEFPYILYDIGEYGLFKNYFCNNSGLFVASRYPITNARFCQFTNRSKQCKLTSKGCIQVKV